MRDKIINFIMWLIAILFLLMALPSLFDTANKNIWSFLVLVSSAMMFMPPVQKIIRRKTKKDIKTKNYLLIGFILFLAGIALSAGDDMHAKENNDKNDSSEQKEVKQETNEDKQVEEDIKVEEPSPPEPITQESEAPVGLEQPEPLIDDSTSSNDDNAPSGVVSQSSDMDFATCMQQQNEMTVTLLSSGNYRVIPIVQTGFLSIVRFCANDGSVLHTCSGEDKKMVITMSSNQEGC